jgi:hypothetical protein
VSRHIAVRTDQMDVDTPRIDWGVMVSFLLGGDVDVHIVALGQGEAVETLRAAADRVEGLTPEEYASRGWQ